MSSSDVLSSPLDASSFASVVGIDVGSQAYVYSVLQPDKRTIVKPTEVAKPQPPCCATPAHLDWVESDLALQ